MANQPGATPNMIAKVLSWIFGEFGTALTADIVSKGILPNLTKGVVPGLASHYLEKDKKFEESRGEFFGFLVALMAEGPEGRQASENAFRRWRARQHCQPRTYGNKTPYEKGDEHIFERLLVHLYRALSEEAERKNRTQVFIRMFNLSDEEFDETLPLLEYDVVINAIRKGAKFLSECNAFLNRPCGAIDKADQRFVNWASKWGINL